MPFLLAHTIFSQLEFEVTTDHYMSNITWKKVPIKQTLYCFDQAGSRTLEKAEMKIIADLLKLNNYTPFLSASRQDIFR
jgi:hypothetical protein